MSDCPIAEWNRGKNVQGGGLRNPQPAAQHGRPLGTCPAQHNRNFKKPQPRGRVYWLEAREEDIEDPRVVVSGTLLVNHLFTRVLFDAGATHSFINSTTTKRLACKLDEMNVH